MVFKKDFFIAVHPGQVLQDILDEAGVTQTQLARHLKMPQSKISEICRGRRGVSPEMAFKLARTFGQSPELWSNLQKNWELSQVEENQYRHIDKMKLRA